jgi:hypothetical protein
MQVKPSKPLRPQQPPRELQQQFLRARQLKPKSFLELHLEILASTQAIHTRTQLLRAATRKLCGK